MNREELLTKFKEYTDRYDISDPKIRLKVEHTYRVADFSERIARSIADDYKLTDKDIELAWTIGMLHDIGRFEQVRRYGTFWDSDSVDHAEFGADLIFGDDPNGFKVELDEPETIEIAIRNHNKLKISNLVTDRQRIFCETIRDADKIDILRVNVEFTVEEIYNVSEEALLNSEISEDVFNAALEGHAVDRALRKTPMDAVVGHASMMQELTFEESRKMVKEQGYFRVLLDKKAKSEDTLHKLSVLREKLAYLL